MQNKPYWLDSRPAFTSAAEGELPARASVVVIGGGFTGLSAARSLARMGIDTIVLDANEIAGGASGRNGGHCSTGTSGDLGALAASIGMAQAVAIYNSFTRAVDLVERIAAEEAIDCDFVRCGKVKLAAKPGHVAKLAKSGELLSREVEPDIELLDRTRMHDEIGSDAFHGALLFKRAASLHVGRFGVGLAEAAARSGARIHPYTPVKRLARVNGGHRVSTPRGTIEADTVLIATGASLSGPFGWFRRRIVPLGSFILATEPLSANRAAAIMPGRRNCVTSRVIGNYFRLTADNRLIFGGRARFALSNPASDAKSGAVLRDAMTAIFPDMRDVRADYVWGGVVDMTQDRLPRTGVHDGLHYAVGLSGHGVQMSTQLGHFMAQRIAGQQPDDPFFEMPFPAIPGHFGPPWFLPFVGAYYRYQDWRN